MKRKQTRFIEHCLFTISLTILILVIASCSSVSTSTSTSTSTLTSPPPATLSSISVTPVATVNLAIGATRQFTATGTYSDDSVVDITSQVTWASSNAAVATVSSAGLTIGIAVGNTEITAALSGVTSPQVNLPIVNSPTLSSISITPESPANLNIGSTKQFEAIGTYSDGSTLDITSQVTWVSYDDTVITVSQTGLVTAVATGNTYITAALSIITSRSVGITVITPIFFSSTTP